MGIELPPVRIPEVEIVDVNKDLIGDKSSKTFEAEDLGIQEKKSKGRKR